MTELDDFYDLRQRVKNGERVSAEEYSRVVENLRKHRTAESSGGKKAGGGGKTKGPGKFDNLDLNDLFNKPTSE